MRLRHRAVCYVVRRHPAGPRVLVFRHPNNDSLQAPAGGIDTGETPEAGATRGVFEETGVRLAGTPRRVHAELGRYSGVDVWRVTHYFVAEAPPNLPETWDHVVTGHGVENGRTFACHWIAADDLDSLAGGQGGAAFSLLLPPRPAPGAVKVRSATPADIGLIHDVRNHAIRESTAIYSDEPVRADDLRDWLENRDVSRHPVTIAELDGEPVGYASLEPFGTKNGYARTAENSVYIQPTAHRRGVGSALLADLIDRGRAARLHTIVARVDSGQMPSLGLHLRHGFTPVGILREAGYKFDQWLDAVYLQRMLD